jgi:hypothetical protein
VISFLTGAETGQAGRIADLVNLVYAESERGLWKDGARRTDAEEITALVEAGQLAVARLDGRLAGDRLHRVGTIGEDHPRLAPHLAGPADYRIYLKRL